MHPLKQCKTSWISAKSASAINLADPVPARTQSGCASLCRMESYINFGYIRQRCHKNSTREAGKRGEGEMRVCCPVLGLHFAANWATRLARNLKVMSAQTEIVKTINHWWRKCTCSWQPWPARLSCPVLSPSQPQQQPRTAAPTAICISVPNVISLHENVPRQLFVCPISLVRRSVMHLALTNMPHNYLN